VDRLSEELKVIAAQQKDHPLAFIENQALFGDLAKNEVFADAFRRSLDQFHELGAHRTVELLNESFHELASLSADGQNDRQSGR
jgi:mannitol 2-dehydrogenase